MPTKHTAPPPDDIRPLAASLDFLTEGEVQALANATPITVESWRKRGVGPAYVRFGNTFLYPREAVAEYLRSKIRERRPVDPKAVL